MCARLVLCAAWVLALTGCHPAHYPDSRPNIVLILADDLGYGDIEPYGNTLTPTPHLSRLAEEGLRFTDFHANGPMCTPTRAALLTGLYQQRFGRTFEGPLSAIDDADTGLPEQAVTVAERLKAAGYATGMFGKWHLGYRPPYLPTRHGFDTFRGLLTGDGDHRSRISRSGTPDWWHDETLAAEEGYTTDLITSHSVAFMEHHRDRPFFLFVSHLAIHFPWQAPGEPAHRQEGVGYWNLDKLGPHPPGEVGPVVQAMIAAVDRSTGQILDAVRDLGIDRRTLVLFTSDNGGYLEYGGRFLGEISSNSPLRGQKGDVFEGGHRVPAIAWWPGRVRPGRTSTETAMTMDLMPTFLELAGADLPAASGWRELDGSSLAPVLFDRIPLPGRTLFWRAGDEAAVRRGPWKLVLADGDTLLYDLEKDLGETADLRATHPDVARDLLASYAGWVAEVDSASALLEDPG